MYEYGDFAKFTHCYQIEPVERYLCNFYVSFIIEDIDWNVSVCLESSDDVYFDFTSYWTFPFELADNFEKAKVEGSKET